MNDLQTLHAVLAPSEVPQDVADRSRHRLQNHMQATPRRRVRPLALGAGLVATAAAAAVVVATLPGAPAQAPPPQAVAPVLTGQEVLLAAATVAERSPADTGKYWHVKTADAKGGYEYWYSADGHLWFRGAKSGGRVMPLGAFKLRLAASEVTFEQLRTLPTDPAALRDWLVNAIAHSGARTSAGPFTAEDRERELLLSMVSLVSTLPAPPAVRAAAFRSIAAYPGVQDLGPVPGGRGFRLPGDYRLVVDPATGRINRTSMYVSADGAIYVVADPQGAQVRSEWTDSLPE
ncbi:MULTISPECIES: CU044_5270 family protein [unclassified Amycolatopsis]|uniref:CU044_5270 family protein n=1 Tax=unclassified Amycolatopsis TaxID=2618356 RepID=UPI00287499BA|nr:MULTISPECIES: CU044_5270 family protein [unclassified Amycolatopsis]MDS0133000.1 CU044_5270 family protein [Amycolatopsis sp. 505]MDS0142175.1 CU044_5270 family protein [Amycolatopsis sp. CM201R]